MNTLASKGPRGYSIATRSLFVQGAIDLEKVVLGGHSKIDKVPLRNVQVVLRIKPVVSKALFARIVIVSSKDTFVNNEDTSQVTSESPGVMLRSRGSSFTKSKISVTVC